MHNLAPANAPWFEHLTDSVRALGEAAREWQLADRQAALLETHVDFLRRNPHEGRISVHGPATTGPQSKPARRTPHERALSDLQKTYMEHRFTTRSRYEHAARLFASGAAWAIAHVQAGETPDRVLFRQDRDYRPVPGAYEVTGLDRYAGADALEAAYERLLFMDHAAEYAEDIAGRDEVSEHEAGEMFTAGQVARDLPDAAIGYGLLAEQALQFVLLGPKAAHRTRMAEERAAQAADCAKTEGGAQ
ncbi:hypothetical protein ACIQJX_35140 [Streptomyces griseoviridis]